MYLLYSSVPITTSRSDLSIPISVTRTCACEVFPAYKEQELADLLVSADGQHGAITDKGRSSIGITETDATLRQSRLSSRLSRNLLNAVNIAHQAAMLSLTELPLRRDRPAAAVDAICVWAVALFPIFGYRTFSVSVRQLNL